MIREAITNAAFLDIAILIGSLLSPLNVCLSAYNIGTTKFSFAAMPYWPITGPPPNTNTSEGETVSYDCTASGKPLPQVTFYKNGVGKLH